MTDTARNAERSATTATTRATRPTSSGQGVSRVAVPGAFVPDADSAALVDSARASRALLRRLPRYQQIAEDLRERIQSGEFPAGSPIPSESEMLAHYGVSRITVRHAIAALRAAGLVISEQGRATRVRPARDGDAELVFDPAVTRTLGPNARFRTWDHEGWADVEAPSKYRTTAGPHAQALGVAPDEPVFVLERQLLHTSGTQVMHRLYLPFATLHDTADTDAGRALAEDPFVAPSDLYQALTDAGLKLTWHDVTRAAMPNPDEAATLDIPTGVPLLIHLRTTTAANRPVALEETRLPAHAASIGTRAHKV